MESETPGGGNDNVESVSDAVKNPATVQAETIVDELHRCGVQEAVLSPGSWSTPLALAFARESGIRLHVRIDERSAAFLALGLAKTSGQTVPVVCTSGSAVANFFPAVLEADAAGVPLLVLSADRPPELRYTGSSQTTDQLKLFGSAVRMFAEVGVAEPRAGSNAYWRSLVGRAVAQAQAVAEPGPVHLNFCFRKQASENQSWPESTRGRADGRAWVRAEQSIPEPVDVQALPRGVMVLGDGASNPGAALAFAERAGWPVLAEPTSAGGAELVGRSGAHALTTGGALLGVPHFVSAHRPELVVTMGKPTVSPALIDFCASANRHIVVDPHVNWADPGRGASRVISALGVPVDVRPDPQWLASWLEADKAARQAITEVLDAETLTEPRLACDLVDALPAGALLFVGSSMPVRDLDATMRPRTGVRIMTNRGLSGIDGVVSTAIGAALAHQRSGGGMAFALLGDLTLLHDHNGFVVGPLETRPHITFIVPNNNGGAIFSTLAQAGVAEFERLFGTPHGVDFSHMAASLSMEYQRLSTVAELKDVVTAPFTGMRLVEVRTDRAANADLHVELSEAVRRTCQ